MCKLNPTCLNNHCKIERLSWGQGIYGKSLYISLNFAVNLKLLQKKRLDNFFK